MASMRLPWPGGVMPLRAAVAVPCVTEFWENHGLGAVTPYTFPVGELMTSGLPTSCTAVASAACGVCDSSVNAMGI